MAEFESYLKQVLIDKIDTIKKSNKIPVMFFLIGTYPGFSNIHQTPPFICEIIKDDKIAPIVILFDEFYHESKKPLEFLVKKNENLEMGKWYYPLYIKELNASYNGKVAYQYYSKNMTENLMKELLTLVSPNISFVWSFTSTTFCKNFNEFCHIPEGNCMANLYFQYEYFPTIKCDKNNNYYIENNGIELDLIIDEIIKIKKLELDNLTRLNQLYGFVYYYINNWKEEFQIYRSWEIQIRLYDPTRKIKLTKESTVDDWNHFKYRVGPCFDVDKLIYNFNKSELYSLEDYINYSIFENGCQLVKLETIGSSNLDTQFQINSFYEQHEDLINTKSSKLPSLFGNYLSEFHKKYSQ
jgi:hypothetical protein